MGNKTAYRRHSSSSKDHRPCDLDDFLEVRCGIQVLVLDFDLAIHHAERDAAV